MSKLTIVSARIGRHVGLRTTSVTTCRKHKHGSKDRVLVYLVSAPDQTEATRI